MWSDSSGAHRTLHVCIGRTAFNDKVLKRHVYTTLESEKTMYTQHSRAQYHYTVTSHTFCAVCATSIQGNDRAKRAACRTISGTAVAAALLTLTLPNARASSGSERAHALPHHPPPAPQAPSRRTPETQSARTCARWRPPLQPPRCALAPHTHCRELWPLIARATPRCRAPGAIPARSRAGSAARVPLMAATAAEGKVAAAATAATTTCCMHTAQPARDCQGARDTRHARRQPRMRGRRSHL